MGRRISFSQAVAWHQAWYVAAPMHMRYAVNLFEEARINTELAKTRAVLPGSGAV